MNSRGAVETILALGSCLASLLVCADHIAEALAERTCLTVIANSAEIACRIARQNGNRVFMARD